MNRSWVWALLVFALHNAEEVVVFASGWPVQHLPRLAWATEQWPRFAGAATILTVCVASVAWHFRDRPDRSARWLRIVLGIMLLNALWHVGVSAYTRSLAPGVVTSVLLIVPVYSMLLRRLSHPGPAAGPAPS